MPGLRRVLVARNLFSIIRQKYSITLKLSKLYKQILRVAATPAGQRLSLRVDRGRLGNLAGQRAPRCDELACADLRDPTQRRD
jgi:hypothetical protein